jgi:serine/threonine-protein kinase RsbW
MRDVQDQIMADVHAHGFDGDDLFAIKLCVEEGLINAIKHGNKQDLSKNVHVVFGISDDEFDITIRDEGAGFIRQEVPDPTDPSNWEKPSGRGLLLMEAYMNKIEYTQGGRQVFMHKKKTPVE